MSKKIIAALIALTVVFMCVFAACNDNTYKNPASGEKYELVTDEDGEKVLNDEGELLVYETDENGKKVTDENGENVTRVQGFVGQIEDGGVVEDYAYKLELPDGWKSVEDSYGKFVNKQKSQECSIDIVEYTYDDYYKLNKDMFNKLAGRDEVVKIKWEDDVTDIRGAEKTCRFILQTEDGIAVLYFFENSGNIYKVLFNSETIESAEADALEFCKAIDFKPYTYYPELTTTEAK